MNFLQFKSMVFVHIILLLQHNSVTIVFFLGVKKMKKRIVSLLLAASLGLSLTGCSSSEKASDTKVEKNTMSDKDADTEKNQTQVSDRLKNIQSKYSSEVLGSPDEIKNLKISLLGKEFKTGQNYREYYDLISKKANECGTGLSAKEPDSEMIKPGVVNNINIKWDKTDTVNFIFSVVNVTDKEIPLGDCQILGISISTDYRKESFVQNNNKWPKDLFVVNELSYLEMGEDQKLTTILDTKEHHYHSEGFSDKCYNDVYKESSAKGELIRQLSCGQNVLNEDNAIAEFVYRTNYFETEESLESSSSKYLESVRRNSICLKLEKVYEKEGKYYADLVIGNNDGRIADENLQFIQKSKWITGYAFANLCNKKEEVDGTRPVRMNVVEDNEGYFSCKIIEDYPDREKNSVTKLKNLKNGDKITVKIDDLSYDACVNHVGEIFYNVADFNAYLYFSMDNNYSYKELEYYDK